MEARYAGIMLAIITVTAGKSGAISYTQKGGEVMLTVSAIIESLADFFESTLAGMRTAAKSGRLGQS